MGDWWENSHFGQRLDISGYSGIGLTGKRRHPLDTGDALYLTLYDQEGDLQTMRVARTRDAEMFQEWLRRYDRYTPRPREDA